VHELRNLHITVYRKVSLLESLIDIFQGRVVASYAKKQKLQIVQAEARAAEFAVR
jgi:hypothetical protein